MQFVWAPVEILPATVFGQIFNISSGSAIALHDLVFPDTIKSLCLHMVGGCVRMFACYFEPDKPCLQNEWWTNKHVHYPLKSLFILLNQMFLLINFVLKFIFIFFILLFIYLLLFGFFRNITIMSTRDENANMYYYQEDGIKPSRPGTETYTHIFTTIYCMHNIFTTN